MRSAVSGALDRSQRNRRPRHAEIDRNRTIRANLRHWQPDYQTIVPETLIGYGRKARPQREVILCIDQSGSMANSVGITQHLWRGDGQSACCGELLVWCLIRRWLI